MGRSKKLACSRWAAGNVGTRWASAARGAGARSATSTCPKPRLC